jgi:GPH family glycoside/pentoside/hexuronide:cation symporter
VGEAKLSVKQKLGFGIYDLGGNMFFTVMGFWCLHYLTDVVGLSAALAGSAVMIGKLWDAVTDPWMGYISDRTRSRWGRRRPYLLFGALPSLLFMWFFFTSPSILGKISGNTPLFLWAVLALMLLNTAVTVTNIPYSSLTPELTGDYHERTSLNGYRFGCAVFGTIIGAAAVQPIAALLPDQKAGFSVLGLILGILMAGTTLLTFFGTREKARSPGDSPASGFLATYAAVFTNKPYLILIITYALHLMGITFLQGILVYYTKYIYNREEITTPAMILLLLTAMCFIPVSVLVSRRIGKKRTYQICFAVLASACAAIFSLGHILGPPFFLALMVYAGIGVGFSYVSPFAMVPDTIEYDAVKTGSRKEGAYYGIWTFVSNSGQALSVFFSGIIRARGGYRADAAQSPAALLAIRLLAGPIPALILIAALLLIQFYPLDEKTYRSLMGQEDGR